MVSLNFHSSCHSNKSSDWKQFLSRLKVLNATFYQILLSGKVETCLRNNIDAGVGKRAGDKNRWIRKPWLKNFIFRKVSSKSYLIT